METVEGAFIAQGQVLRCYSGTARKTGKIYNCLMLLIGDQVFKFFPKELPSVTLGQVLRITTDIYINDVGRANFKLRTIN